MVPWMKTPPGFMVTKLPPTLISEARHPLDHHIHPFHIVVLGDLLTVVRFERPRSRRP